eukprot:COSAG01_NODE_14741_length_1414_cov_12.485562_2_plen_152_part_01
MTALIQQQLDNQVALAAAGGIEAVVAALQVHPGAANVQEHGCLALGNLTANHAVPHVSGEEKTATATVMFEYEAADVSDLALTVGSTIVVTDTSDTDWWKGSLRGKPEQEGFFPASFVELDGSANQTAAAAAAAAAAGGIEAVVAAVRAHPG